MAESTKQDRESGDLVADDAMPCAEYQSDGVPCDNTDTDCVECDKSNSPGNDGVEDDSG